MSSTAEAVTVTVTVTRTTAKSDGTAMMKVGAKPMRGFELVGREGSRADEFTALFHEHQTLVRSVIYQIAGPSLLSDLVQDAFIKIWKGLPDFREEAKLTSWIYRVAANTALDSLKSGARKYESNGHDLGTFVDDRHDGERDLANRQLVERGLAALSVEHRAVVVLALMHERTTAEVAEILGISEGTVKSRLHYGRDHFRKILEGDRT